MSSVDYTRELAAFAAEFDSNALPERVRIRLAQCLADFVAVTAGGHRLAESSAALLVAMESEAGGPATVVGSARGYGWRGAALLNGAFAHSLDFDDTNIASGLHPGAPVIAAALAIAEREDASGVELLTAIAVGYEVCCRVGLALGKGAYLRGFHPTAIAGVFGAVAAGARLSGLDADRTNAAFGLAGSMAAGSMQYLENGGWNKRLHPGLAAQNALLAVDFARAGVKAADRALDGRGGVLTGYTATPDPAELAADLGTRWILADTGIKPYPACRLTHGAIDAAIQLHAQLDGKLAPDHTLALRISHEANAIVGGPDPRKRRPANSVDAQFSVFFQTAVAFETGAVNWSSYDAVADPAIEALIDRIALSSHDDIPAAGAELVCLSADTEIARVSIDRPSGEPGTDLPWTEIEAKYHSLTADLLDARAALDWIRHLPHDRPVRALTALLRSQ